MRTLSLWHVLAASHSYIQCPFLRGCPVIQQPYLSFLGAVVSDRDTLKREAVESQTETNSAQEKTGNNPDRSFVADTASKTPSPGRLRTASSLSCEEAKMKLCCTAFFLKVMDG